MRTPGTFVLLVVVVITTGMVRPAMAEHEYNVVRPLLGGVVGGVLGSVLGSSIGNDKWKRAGAGVGAALGLLAGHELARREHVTQTPRPVSVPHALHVPPLRIQQPTRTLNCKIIDQAERIYACRDHSGRWTLRSARTGQTGLGREPERHLTHQQASSGSDRQPASGYRGDSDHDVIALRPGP